MGDAAEDLEPGKRGVPRVNWRVVGLLAFLSLVISGAVIVTDIVSPRNRHPATAATLPVSLEHSR